MLGEAHGPTANETLGVHRNLARLPDLISRQSGASENWFPRCGSERIDERLKSGRVFRDEIMIKNRLGLLVLGRQHLFHDTFEQGEISIDLYRQPEIRKADTTADRGNRAVEIVGVLKSEIAGLRQGVNADDLRTIAFGPLQRSQHPRMIGSRVLPDDENRIGQIEVV